MNPNELAQPMIGGQPLVHAVVGLMVGILVLLIVGYIARYERERRVGARLLEEFETRRKQLEINDSALNLAHQHVSDLRFLRQSMDRRPLDWPSYRVPAPLPSRRTGRPQLHLVRSGVPIKCESFDPDDAA